MSNVLVTGAAGFIGSHVCDSLLQADFNVFGLDDLSEGFRENIHERVHFIEGSILDTALVNQLFEQHRFEYVFHLAAYAAEGLSHFIRHFNYTNNLLGSVNIINASVNTGSVKCFVFTSSIAVYGRNQVPMAEDTIPRPEDPYGISKYAVELDLRTAHELFGLNYIIFRPHNVYGDRQNLGNPYRNVLGIFMNQAMQDKELTIFGDGSQTRAFSHILDVAPVIAGSVLRPEAYNEVFNVGADRPVSVLELAAIIGRVFKIEPRIRFLDARNEVLHAYSNHDKVKRLFGDLIRGVELESGIEQMMQWARKTGPKSGKRFAGVEIEKNMPPSWKNLRVD